MDGLRSLTNETNDCGSMDLDHTATVSNATENLYLIDCGSGNLCVNSYQRRGHSHEGNFSFEATRYLIPPIRELNNNVESIIFDHVVYCSRSILSKWNYWTKIIGIR